MRLTGLTITSLAATMLHLVSTHSNFISYNPLIPCKGIYEPEFCNFPNITLSSVYTVEDFDRCGPAALSIPARDYFWAAAGSKVTYRRNFRDFKRFRIVQSDLQDVSHSDLTTYVLGQKISVPIAFSPTAAQKLGNPQGEIATVRAAAKFGTLMILSCFATYALEDVAEAAFDISPSSVLWMELYLFKDRRQTLDIVRRAEEANYSALVVTVDSPLIATVSCESREIMHHLKLPNFFNNTEPAVSDAITFADLAWLKTMTNLPIVAKGILTASDAIKAIKAGSSAIFVSNHGGRQLDSAPSTIRVVSEIAETVKADYPWIEVYMDGGVRSGWDVYKTLARGAKAAFMGRPVLWGLAVGGEEGVTKILNIVRDEFSHAMLLAGYTRPSDISASSVIPVDNFVE